MAARENEVQRACLQLLAALKIPSWRTNNTGIFDPTRKRFRSFSGMKGVADILALLAPGGRLLAVEAKAGKGKLSPAQVAFGEMVREAGGLYVVAYNVGDLIAALRAEGVRV